MVFESLFSIKEIWEKKRNLFVLGCILSELGIISALLVFGRQHAGIMSIAFTSVLITPILNHATKQIKTGHELKLNLKSLFIRHRELIQVYSMLFLGILCSYAIIQALMPVVAEEKVFLPQLTAYGALPTGEFGHVNFQTIFFGNFIVLCACFAFSLIYDVGSMLFLTWNASVWGALIGYMASIVRPYENALFSFIDFFLRVFPHMFTEAIAYFLAIIGGVIISKAIVQHKRADEAFNIKLQQGLILFVISILILLVGAWLEVVVFQDILIGGLR